LQRVLFGELLSDTHYTLEDSTSKHNFLIRYDHLRGPIPCDYAFPIRFGLRLTTCFTDGAPSFSINTAFQSYFGSHIFYDATLCCPLYLVYFYIEFLFSSHSPDISAAASLPFRTCPRSSCNLLKPLALLSPLYKASATMLADPFYTLSRSRTVVIIWRSFLKGFRCC